MNISVTPKASGQSGIPGEASPPDQHQQHQGQGHNQNQLEHVHGGAVLVRGMIRRIWRPRYLEIDAEGVLRYYEAADASDHGSIPKTQPRTRTRKRSPDRDISREMQAFALPEDLTRTTPAHIDRQSLKANVHAMHSSTAPARTMNGSGSASAHSGEENVSCKSGDKAEENVPQHRHGEINASMSDEGTAVEVELEQVYMNVNTNTEGNKPSSLSSSYTIKKESSSSNDGLLNHVESWDSVKEDQANASRATGTTQKASSSNSSMSATMSPTDSNSNFNASNNHSTNDMHQVPDTNAQSQSKQQQQYVPHHHIHSHRPKATMTILSARLIDVKSLRDIHVGLPKGTYGFVFCGRQIFNNHHETSLDDLGLVTCGSGSFVGTGTGSDGLAVAQDAEEDYYHELSEESAHHHGHFEIRDDICHPLSILSNVDHDYFDSSRDYLCSVSTEDEAKKWVQKLKRAAQVARSKSKHTASKSNAKKRKQKNTVLRKPNMNVILDGGSSTVQSPLASPGMAHNYGVFDDLTMMMDDDDSSVMDMSHTKSLLSNSTTCTDSQAPADGLTIVTRVQSCGVKSLGRKRLLGVHCEIQYQVQILLLSNDHLMHRSKRREKGQKANDESYWTVEQKTVSRSHEDAMQFLETFNQMPKGNSVRLMEKIMQDMESSKMDNTLSMPLLHKQLSTSVKNFDKALRIITSDPTLCNTRVAKEFLGVMNQTNFGTSSALSTGIKSEQIAVAAGDSVDDFVKKWLCAETRNFNLMERVQVYVMLMLRKPNVEAILYAKLALLAKYMLQVWSSNPFGHTIEVRIDIIVAALVTVYYCGHSSGTSSTKLQHERMVRNIKHESKKKKHTTSIGVKVQRKQKMLEECSLECEDEEYSSSAESVDSQALSSPLPEHSEKNTTSCWSRPDDKIFNVRGKTYLKDRIKVPSRPSLFKCRGIDLFLTDNPERNISRLPCVLGGKLSAASNTDDTFVVNFLLPFGNFVSYFSVANEDSMPDNVAKVWKNFVNGDQMYRDARLKLLPVVVEGPWIVKKAVGPGTAPALLSQSIPLQYYFTHPTEKKRGIYEVDVIITASKIARGILSVVKSHTKRLTIGMAFIIEAATEDELPETVLASCQLHNLHLELCPQLPKYYLEEDFVE